MKWLSRIPTTSSPLSKWTGVKSTIRTSAEMVAQLDDAMKRGARGLKVLKDLGLGLRDKSGNLVAIDEPRIDPVWEECGFRS